MAVELLEEYLREVEDPSLRRVIERVLLLEEEHASYKQPALKGQVLEIVRSEASR